ncbi:hypothetical protein [Williamsia sp. D3]|nr:hypothetical protein [Williamsia sp. D3]ETD32525.1 hypothetical protein W823_14205 [Williamsia sp. D3]
MTIGDSVGESLESFAHPKCTGIWAASLHLSLDSGTDDALELAVVNKN